MVSGCVGFLGDFALTFGFSGSLSSPFRAQSFKSFSSPGRPSLVTNADDLTGLHAPKGVENLRHERTQFLHRFVRATAITTAMPLARKFC